MRPVKDLTPGIVNNSPGGAKEGRAKLPRAMAIVFMLLWITLLSSCFVGFHHDRGHGGGQEHHESNEHHDHDEHH